MTPLRSLPKSRFSARPLRIFAFCSILLACVQGASGGWLEDQIVWIQNRLNQTYSKANTAASQAVKAAQNTNGLKDIVVRAQNAYQSLDGPIIEMINDLVQMMIDFVQAQQDGYEDFIAAGDGGKSPADAFRAELEAMTTELATFLNEISALDGGFSLNLDFPAIGSLIEITPDRLLYPFQKVLVNNAGLMELGLLERIEELREDLPLFQAAYAQEGSFEPAYSPAGIGTGDSVYAWSSSSRAVANRTGQGWKATGTVLGLTGKTISALGEMSSVEAKAGIHGYVAGHFEINIVAVIGGLLETLADAVSKNGERLEGILAEADTLDRHSQILTAISDSIPTGRLDDLGRDHDDLLQGQQNILDGQQRLFEAMKRLDPDLFPEISQVPPTAAMQLDDQPRRVQVDVGEPVTLSAMAVDSPNAVYQWRKDGVAISGAVYSSLIIRQATSDDVGEYDVVITDESGSEVSAAASLALIPGRVLNVSVRQVIPDNGVLITGFVLDSQKQVVVRGVGRSLAAFGIPEAQTMQDPIIRIYNAANEVVAENDNYERTFDTDAVMQAVGAFPITASSDAAIVTTLPEGHYTVHMKGADLKGGDCIVEVYDTEDS
ncbi:MAG: hypothetical protein DRP71_11015 [Verrucomicrobia bacterium]|nr:MAG: hypothetical protein DRP71_11015 [Verrucomicrobiota bacterium]